jgi:hypothetical protein
MWQAFLELIQKRLEKVLITFVGIETFADTAVIYFTLMPSDCNYSHAISTLLIKAFSVSLKGSKIIKKFSKLKHKSQVFD